MSVAVLFHQLYEPRACAFTYLLADPATGSALIIDPVLETSARDLLLINELGFGLRYILETHLHADHLTGAWVLRCATNARIAVSRASGIRCADVLLDDGSVLRFGNQSVTALATPGHTNGCVSYYIAGKVFTGDCLLIRGTGRTDLDQGNAAILFAANLICGSLESGRQEALAAGVPRSFSQSQGDSP